jgi:4-hydroxy-tetrahydrodipicolinate synthase
LPDHRIDNNTSGVFIISATPFQDNGALDRDSTDRLIEFYIGKKVTGITILGMMGEAPKLSSHETLEFVKAVMARVAGRVPVIVGVSNAGLDNLAQLARESMNLGAAGVMVAPFAGLDTEEKLYNYYAQVCEALGPDTPICYQDYPLTTNAPVSVPCLERIFSDFSQIVMFKHEDWPGLAKISRLRDDSSGKRAPRVSILCGNGGLYLPLELARGADGAMTGFAYPEMLVAVVEKFQSGDIDGAEDLFDAYLPLVRYEQQPGIGLAVRKEVLRRRGIISTARTRKPGPSLSSMDHEELTRLIDRTRNALGTQ